MKTVQNAMFVAGIATLIQLYPIWKVGSKLSIVMGVSFTFVTVLSTIAVNYGYPTVTGAVCMIIAGLLPPVGNFFASLPESVLGGCTIMMFGTILTSGMQMAAKAGFNQRNITIAALSLSIGIGFTTASEIGLWHIFPKVGH